MALDEDEAFPAERFDKFAKLIDGYTFICRENNSEFRWMVKIEFIENKVKITVCNVKKTYSSQFSFPDIQENRGKFGLSGVNWDTFLDLFTVGLRQKQCVVVRSRNSNFVKFRVKYPLGDAGDEFSFCAKGDFDLELVDDENSERKRQELVYTFFNAALKYEEPKPAAPEEGSKRWLEEENKVLRKRNEDLELQLASLQTGQNLDSKNTQGKGKKRKKNNSRQLMNARRKKKRVKTLEFE